MKPPVQPSAGTERPMGSGRSYLREWTSDVALDELVQLTAQICITPVALVYFADAGQEGLMASYGWPKETLSGRISFCSSTILQRDLLVVSDTLQEERFSLDPLVTNVPFIRFYAGFPLISSESEALGVLCIMDRTPRHLTAAESNVLRVMSKQVMLRLESDLMARELLATQTRLRSLTESVGIGLAVVDRDHRFEYANASYAAMLGLTLSEIVGQNVGRLLGKDYEEQIRAALNRAFAGQKLSHELRALSGANRCVVQSYEPGLKANEVGTVVVTLIDISERKKTEERAIWLSSFPEKNPNPIIEFDLCTGGMEYANPVALAWFPDLSDLGVRHPLVAGLLELQSKLAEERILRREVKVGEFYFAQTITDGWSARRVRVYSTDITERKRSEAAMRESEQRFRTMADSIPQLAWIAQADGYISWYNQRWYDYTGTTREEMEGWGWQSVHDGRVLPKVMESWKAALASGQPFEMEFPLRKADGQLRTFLTRVMPFKDADGQVVQWFGTNTDVEELKRVEESLRSTRARLQSTMIAGAVGTWTWDLVKDSLVADEFTARMFSIDPGVASAGLPAQRYLQEIHPADRPSVKLALERAIRSCGAYDIEYRVRRDQEEFRWLQARGRVDSDSASKPTTFHGAVIDITERKRIESRFRRLVDSNAQGVIFWNTNGRITDANDAFLKIVGYSREDLTAGLINWAEMTPSEFAHLDRDALGSLAAHGVSAPMEKEYIRKDGSRVPILLGAALFEDSSNEGICFVIDISERKHLDQALRESEELFRFLDDLAESSRALADTGEIMTVMTAKLGKHLGASRCAYATVEINGEWFTILHDYTDACASTVGKYQLSRFGVQAATTLCRGDTLIICDVDQELLPGEGADMFRAIGIRAIIACPLVKDGVLLAMMALHQSTPRDWKSKEVRLVRDVVERCWATIERRLAEERLNQLNLELERRVLERTSQLEFANHALQQSRAELSSLFESLPGLYLVLSTDLDIVSVSDAYLKATMTTREAILGRALFEILPENPDDRNPTGVANLIASLDRVKRLRVADTMAIQKYDVRRPDGSYEERYWSPINSPVFGADRQLKYIVHRVEEVTNFVKHKVNEPHHRGVELDARLQRMEAEVFESSQRLQATNRQLESANKELEAFSYTVSHDLRSPLRAVDGYAQLVLSDYLDLLPAEGQRYLEAIRQGAQRMGLLIDELLNFSRLSRVPLIIQAVDTMEQVQATLDELLGSESKRNIRTVVNGLPPCEGDPALLRQVWVNLLSNAIKYSAHREEAVIEIGSHEERGITVYYVRDNGAGFDMRYAGKLFGVFQRLHRQEDFPGTGVGLAIIQRIVSRHGGRIWAESAIDRGATFYFTLKCSERE